MPVVTVDPARVAPDEAALASEALRVSVHRLRLIERWPLGDGAVAGFVVDDDPRVTAYVDTSGRPVPVETGLAINGHARVWMHPADPYLPALAPVAFGPAATALLARAGVTVTAGPRLVAYRPGRRAVAAIETDAGTLWAKVVRPGTAERIARVNAALRDGGLPVPEVRWWSPDGLLIAESAAGSPAAREQWRPGPLVDAVERMRAALAGVPLTEPSRTSIHRRVPWYLDRLRRVDPAGAARLSRIGRRVRTLPPGGERTTIHGDLHLGQLFLGQLFLGDRTTITGIIDVDTAGVGDPSEDEAAFIGHTLASAALTADPGASARLRRLAAELEGRWGRRPRTRGLTVVHLLGHALTAAEQGHLDRARHLLELADLRGDDDEATA